jgi:hypothetical protein
MVSLFGALAWRVLSKKAKPQGLKPRFYFADKLPGINPRPTVSDPPVPVWRSRPISLGEYNNSGKVKGNDA